MKSFRENPDSEENQKATRENEAYIKALQHLPPQSTAWFTFGQTHAHSVNGITFDKDCVVKITAADPRGVMFGTFGNKWSMQYDEEPDMSFYHRGIFDL